MNLSGPKLVALKNNLRNPFIALLWANLGMQGRSTTPPCHWIFQRLACSLMVTLFNGDALITGSSLHEGVRLQTVPMLILYSPTGDWREGWGSFTHLRVTEGKAGEALLIYGWLKGSQQVQALHTETTSQRMSYFGLPNSLTFRLSWLF